MQPKQIIQCSQCGWNPDGKAYWSCTCGQQWNTFETQSRCPACETKYEMTACPACGQTTPHLHWYTSKDLIEQKKLTKEKTLVERKQRIETKLANYGMVNSKITFLPYLDASKVELQTTGEAAGRMMILYAIAYAVHNLENRTEVMAWMKNENLLEMVSPSEKKFLIEENPSDEELADRSWQIEGALTLAWTLNLIPHLPQLDLEDNEATIDDFIKKVPEIGSPIGAFFNDLSFRPKREIFEENILNEIATGYFRDLIFSKEEDQSTISRAISFQRHLTLNWLRKFNGCEDWDEADTST